MEVWVYSVDDEDWVPGHIVSITKQLVSVIFNGDDFRWLEKESDLFRTEDDKPEPLNHKPEFYDENGSNNDNYNFEQVYSPPKNDKMDYYVTFEQPVLGLELYSDEDGFNCIVGRCVSLIAQSKVIPTSSIVRVNERWLANFRFEEIRDAVKQAAKNPPLNVTFRVKKSTYKNPPVGDNKISQNNKNNSPQMAINDKNQNQINHIQNQNQPNENQKKQKQNQNSNQYFSNYENHNFMNKNTNEPISENSESVDDEKLAQPKKPNENFLHLPILTWNEALKLKANDQVDHRDDVGRFLLATVLEKDDSRVKIHYEGWNSKWDSWCDLKNELHRFAPPRSISRKPNTRFRDLKIRDYVDINPLQRHKGWRVGQIRRMDKYSGQAQIVYKEEGQEFLYWSHLNNLTEIAPFMTKATDTIPNQVPYEQMLNDEQQYMYNGGPQNSNKYHNQKQKQKQHNNEYYHDSYIPPPPPKNDDNYDDQNTHHKNDYYDNHHIYNKINYNKKLPPGPK